MGSPCRWKSGAFRGKVDPFGRKPEQLFLRQGQTLRFIAVWRYAYASKGMAENSLCFDNRGRAFAGNGGGERRGSGDSFSEQDQLVATRRVWSDRQPVFGIEPCADR